MTRAITPEAMNNRERFEMLRTKGEEGFCKGEGRMDDEVEGYYRDSRFFVKPLEVMLGSYLNGSRFREGEVCSRTIEGAMKELAVRKVRLKSSKLSIRPPILLGSKSVNKVGRAGGEGALRKFRGDY